MEEQITPSYVDSVYNDLTVLLAQDSWEIKPNIQQVVNARSKILPYLSEARQNILTGLIKSKIQRDADVAHRAAGRWGMICNATGTGKSRIAINMAEKLVNFKPDARILLVVPTEKLRDNNWREEFDECGQLTIYQNNVTRICYKSMSKVKLGFFDLVVLDECHNLSEKQAEFFQNNKVAALVALTATKPKKTAKRFIFEQLNINLVYEITLDEAVDLGVVAPYEITVVSVPLDGRDRYIKAGSAARPFYQTEVANYDYFIKWEHSPERMGDIVYRKRMHFIYNLKSKTEAAKYILQGIPQEKRVVIFCGSTEQANAISSCTYHSKSIHDCYDEFKNMEVNRMACVNSVNEGHNLPFVDLGIVVQVNSNDLHFIQRLGRIIRYRPGHIGRFIVLVAEGTVDVTWLNDALRELNPNRIRRIKYHDLVVGKEVLTF